jgi:hydrogenase/urease accessory protein HupE
MAHRVALLVALQFGTGLLGSVAYSHALEPGYLEIREIDRTLYAVVWKKPAVVGAPMAIAARLPESCDPRAAGELSWDGTAYYARWTATCTDGISGGEVTIAGLGQTSTDVLVRILFADGTTRTQRLTPITTSFVIAGQPGRLEIASTYFGFGVEHILLGIDHLLFVLALLILVKGKRRLVATVTAFTLAHSMTLAGATLGWVYMPGPPLEAVIALSIAFVAAEIIHGRQGKPGLTERYPWVVAFAFGLLHGFGFAGALTQVGLPQVEIPLALLFFNVGVEVGQLLFIAAVFAAVWIFHRVVRHMRLPRVRGAPALSSYLIGGLAMFWVIERTVAFFP